jgi:TetR/AcrR family transcriptional repressor of nem operon
MEMSGHESKTKLLDATLKVVRSKGYAATRIEDVCAEAGLTKGSFFHHFKSKDDLALSAVSHWDRFTTAFFAEAPYHAPDDPLDRLLAYVDFRISLIAGTLPEFTCFAGTLVQETYETHADICAASGKNISDHARTLEADIRAAMRQYRVKGDWTAESLAISIQSAVQGAFILAKATGSATAAVQTLEHMRRYLELLFRSGSKRPQSRQMSKNKKGHLRVTV